jgi:hypothetical protein
MPETVDTVSLTKEAAVDTVSETQLAAVDTVLDTQLAAWVTVETSELAAGIALATALATDCTADVTLEKKDFRLIFLPSRELLVRVFLALSCLSLERRSCQEIIY